MKYRIYQIAGTKDVEYYFMSWSFIQRHNINFDFKDYCCFYMDEIDEVDAYVALERLFTIFNIHRPGDFKGHSLSVSDIVTLESADGNIQYYYCDSMGWENITPSITGQKEKEEKKLDLHARAELVKAMDLLVRSINDEDLSDHWLEIGVADGAVNDKTTDEDLECYCEDSTLAGLMNTFLNLMSAAKKDGIVCDGIVSK